MTYADPYLNRQGIIFPEFLDDVAIGIESSDVRRAFQISFEHYNWPFSRTWANDKLKFLTLKAEWEIETAHLSSITEIAIHPAYQQIIGMGRIAVPFILSELKKKPGHWFWALKSITGEDPVLPAQRGRIRQMTQAWLRWGRAQGYPV